MLPEESEKKIFSEIVYSSKIKESYMKRLCIIVFSLFLVFVVSAIRDNDQKPSRVSEKLSPMTDIGIISYPVQAGGKWGFIDKTGKIVITPRFDDAPRR